MGIMLTNTEVATIEAAHYEVVRISLVGLTNAFMDREGKADETLVADNVAIIMTEVGLGYQMLAIRRETIVQNNRTYRGVQMKAFLEGYDVNVQEKFQRAAERFLRSLCQPGVGQVYMTIGDKLYKSFLRSQQRVPQGPGA